MCVCIYIYLLLPIYKYNIPKLDHTRALLDSLLIDIT